MILVYIILGLFVLLWGGGTICYFILPSKEKKRLKQQYRADVEKRRIARDFQDDSISFFKVIGLE